MKLIKLDRRHHGYAKWTHALQFTKRDTHGTKMIHYNYIRAFTEIYGDDRTWKSGSFLPIYNPDWIWDCNRSRIYFNDPRVLTLIELKVA